jgi:hypothetical protein
MNRSDRDKLDNDDTVTIPGTISTICGYTFA